MQPSRLIRTSLFRVASPFAALAAFVGLALYPHAAAVAAAPERTVAFEIVAPAEGATVQRPVRLELSLSGAEIGRPSDGLDHVHVAVDGGRARSIYEPGPIPLDLAPGKHTVMVEIAGPNHRALLPAKHVSFTVE